MHCRRCPCAARNARGSLRRARGAVRHT
jgi:hypothetical protein